MEIRGRCLLTGLPKTLMINSTEIAEALIETGMMIADAAHAVLEATPPELVGDISHSGIVVTGGGGLIWGLDILLQKRTGVDVYVAEDAISCVAKGTGMSLEYIDKINEAENRRKIII